MWYFKTPGFVIRRSPSGKSYQGYEETEWGRITQYLEVADDQRAVRQVDVYGNGYLLRYDREHEIDDYGRLLGVKFSRKPKWRGYFPRAEIISAGEFEKVWRRALASPLWERQFASRPS
jgi:hypothetical protein